MENPFKEIITNKELPELIRKKIMNDVEIIQLSLDLADLFALKYPESISDIIKITRKK